MTLIDRSTWSPADSIFYILANFIRVYTIDPNKLGTYNLRLVGAVSTYKSAYVDFDVYVIDSCQTTTLVPSVINDYTYDLGTGL